MRRRDFIAALGGAAAWPSAALPQAPGTPMIGFMSSRSREESTPHLEGFLRGLKDNGYIPGQTVAIEYRWANGRYERLPMLAAELVALHPVALAAPGGPPSALAAKAATSTIPVIFVADDDPVSLGLVASFNRPGGNVTGVSLITTDLGAKRVELLLELVPGATAIALLLNPNNPDSAQHRQDVQVGRISAGVGYLSCKRRSKRNSKRILRSSGEITSLGS